MSGYYLADSSQFPLNAEGQGSGFVPLNLQHQQHGIDLDNKHGLVPSAPCKKINDQTRRLIGQSFSKIDGDISPSASAAHQGHKALEKAAGVRDHNIYMTPHGRKGLAWENIKNIFPCPSYPGIPHGPHCDEIWPDKGNLTGGTAFAPERKIGSITLVCINTSTKQQSKIVKDHANTLKDVERVMKGHASGMQGACVLALALQKTYAQWNRVSLRPASFTPLPSSKTRPWGLNKQERLTLEILIIKTYLEIMGTGISAGKLMVDHAGDTNKKQPLKRGE
ncbi:hypothetical protein C8J56DRAFT_899648 [Mycena floridula]|nr:hypothetical protein C8J56DRAFT_899648 [Mycena floridula]